MEKIPKTKTFPNVYKKMLGVMLLVSLLFAGCKRKDVLPEPAHDAIDSATLAKIQAWYNPKVARLRGAKSTG
ncbi:MAG: hypothetical protein EAZ95_14605, partial [Bacteroidetes bacterium]